MTPEALLDLATRVETKARELGASEAGVAVSTGTHTTLQRREGKVERATSATTRGLGVSLLVDGRYSSHNTSDLRPEALDRFLEQAVAATRFLEPDPYRGQAEGERCGRAASEDELDLYDPHLEAITAEERAQIAEEIETHVNGLGRDDVASASVYVADGSGTTARVMSNGFAEVTRGGWFARGGDITATEPGGKRPEAAAYYSARHASDLPDNAFIAHEIGKRLQSRLGSKSIESGAYPMLLANRATGRILGVLGGPLSGGALHQKRSCLLDKLGESIASNKLTLLDDPLRPRGLSSRPFDGDGMFARPRTIIDRGVLQQYYIGVYHGRKLGTDPTTGGRSNWVVPAGERSPEEIAKAFPKAIWVDGFMGGNSNPVTGDFSFGIRGMLLEHGEPVQSLSEMNVSGNLLGILGRLTEVANDPWTYSSLVTPTLVFDDVQFSGL
ncbi:MAG: TldD/PmbA family protein [Deltaproteobacteria bacterium]|nr:MAG: TldD/PmbA family protein [Deltaproteobacteria bacterium]